MDDLFLDPLSHTWATPDPHRNADVSRPAVTMDESSVDLYGDLSMSSIKSDLPKAHSSPEKQARRHFSRIADAKRPASKEDITQTDPAETCNLDLFTEHLVDELSLKEKFETSETLNASLQKELKQVTSQNDQLRKNISSLFLTAKQEIQEKDREIAKLRAMMLQIGSTEAEFKERHNRWKDDPSKKHEFRDRSCDEKYSRSERQGKKICDSFVRPNSRENHSSQSPDRKGKWQSPAPVLHRNDSSSMVSGLDQRSQKRKFDSFKIREDSNNKVRKKEASSRLSDKKIDKFSKTKSSYHNTERKRDDSHKTKNRYPVSEMQDDSRTSKSSQRISDERSHRKDYSLSVKDKDDSSLLTSYSKKVEFPSKQTSDNKKHAANEANCSNKPNTIGVDSTFTDLRQKLKKRKWNANVQPDHKAERESKRSKAYSSEETKDSFNYFSDDTIKTRVEPELEEEFPSTLKNSPLSGEKNEVQQKTPVENVQITVHYSQKKKESKGEKGKVVDRKTVEQKYVTDLPVCEDPTVTQETAPPQVTDDSSKVPRGNASTEIAQVTSESSAGKTAPLSKEHIKNSLVKVSNEFELERAAKILNESPQTKAGQLPKNCAVDNSAKVSSLLSESSSAENTQSPKECAVDDSVKISKECAVDDPVKISKECAVDDPVKISKECAVDDSVKISKECAVDDLGKKSKECAVNEPVKISTECAIDKSEKISKECAVDNPVKISKECAVDNPVKISKECAINKSEKISKECAVDNPVKISKECAVDHPVKISTQCAVDNPVKISKQCAVDNPVKISKQCAVDYSVKVSNESAEKNSLMVSNELRCKNTAQVSNNLGLKETVLLPRGVISISPVQLDNEYELESDTNLSSELVSKDVVEIFSEHGSIDAAQVSSNLISNEATQVINESASSSAVAVTLNNLANLSNSEQVQTLLEVPVSFSALSSGNKHRYLSSETADKQTDPVASEDSMDSRQEMKSSKVETERQSEILVENKTFKDTEVTSGGYLFNAVAKTSSIELNKGFAFLCPDVSNQESSSIASTFSVPFRNMKSLDGNSVSNINSTNSTWPFDVSNSTQNNDINSVILSTNSKLQVPPLDSADSDGKKNLKIGGNIHENNYITDDQNNSCKIKDVRAFPISSLKENFHKKAGISEVLSEKIETENEETSGDSTSSSSSKESKDSSSSKSNSNSGTTSRSSSKNLESVDSGKDGSNQSASSQSCGTLSTPQEGNDDAQPNMTGSPACGDMSKVKSDDNLDKSSCCGSLDGSSSEDLEKTPHKARPADIGEMGIVCTSNLIILGDEDTTCTTFASPSKPALLPSEFYPPGVRGKIHEGGSHSRHIRGGSEVLFKPIRPVLQDDGDRGFKTIFEKNEAPTVISDDSSSRDSDVILQQVEGPQVKPTETNSALVEPMLVCSESAPNESGIVTAKTESTISPFNFSNNKMSISDNNLTVTSESPSNQALNTFDAFEARRSSKHKAGDVTFPQKTDVDNIKIFREIQGTSASENCSEHSEKRNQVHLTVTGSLKAEEIDITDTRSSFEVWKDTMQKTYFKVFQQELKTFKESLMEEVLSKAHQAAQMERKKELEKLQSAVNQFIKSNVPESLSRDGELSASLETPSAVVTSVRACNSLTLEQLGSTQPSIGGIDSVTSCQSMSRMNTSSDTKSKTSTLKSPIQQLGSYSSMSSGNDNVKKSRNSKSSIDLRLAKKKNYSESVSAGKRESALYSGIDRTRGSNGLSTEERKDQCESCAEYLNKTKVLQPQAMKNSVPCLWRASPDSCVVTSSDCDKKASSLSSKACLVPERESATCDAHLHGEPDSTSDGCWENSKQNSNLANEKLCNNEKVKRGIPASNERESKVSDVCERFRHDLHLCSSCKSVDSLESQVNVAKTDRASTAKKSQLYKAINTQEHIKSKPAIVKQSQHDKSMPMSVKQSQPDKLFSGKVKIAQQYGKSMLTRVKQYDNSVSDKAIQQHKKSFSDMANIVQPGKSSSDVANAKQQPGKWMLKMANTAQEPDQSRSSSNMTCCSTSNLTKKGQKSNKSTPAKTNISQQPDNLILSNKPILYEITDAAQSAKLILEGPNKVSSLQNSTPKRPNVVTAPDETSIAIHSNKFIDAIENLATPPERSTFVLEPSPILDECSQFQSPGRTVPLHKNGVGAETALNSTFTVHELSDEQIDHETTLVSADHPEQGEKLMFTLDEVSLCSNSLSEFDKDVSHSTPRCKKVSREGVSRISPVQPPENLATRSFSEITKFQMTSSVFKNSSPMEKSREVLWLTKQIPLAQASCNESSPGANEQNSISFIESSLIHGKDDGTKLLSEVGFQSLEQKPPSEEFSKKDNQETPNSFHSDSSEDLSKHLTYQELHEMGLVKRFYYKNIPDSSPINVLESTIEESDESFVTCRQFSSEELLFIENVQKVRKNLNKELENNSETTGISCGDKLSYQSSATYALSSSKNRILSSDLYISESESDGFPSPLKKPTNPGPIVSNVEDRRQVDKLTPSQENSHLTRVSDLEFSSSQEVYDCVVDSEPMVDADKTLIEDNEVCLSPAKELASRDESLEEGEIDDGDDGETKIVESSAKSDPASFNSKTCPRNAVIKSSENTGRADALDKKRKRLRSWPCKGFGKAESVMSPLERIYRKQNTSRAGYNLGKTGPTFFGNRNRLASPNSKQKSLISRRDRECDVKGRSMKKSEKLDCGRGGVNNAETKRLGKDEENDFARRRSSNRRKNEQSASTSNTKVEGKSRSSHPYGKGTNSLYDGTAEVGETEDLWTCQGNSSESLPQSAHNGVEIRNKIGSYGGKGGVQLSHGEDSKRPHIRNVCDWDTPDCKTSLNQDNPSGSQNSIDRDSQNQRDSREQIKARSKSSYKDRLVCGTSSEIERSNSRNSSRERPSSRNSSRERPSSRNSCRERPISRNSCRERPSSRNSSRSSSSSRNSQRRKHSSKNSQKQRSDSRNSCSSENSYDRN